MKELMLKKIKCFAILSLHEYPDKVAQTLYEPCFSWGSLATNQFGFYNPVMGSLPTNQLAQNLPMRYKTGLSNQMVRPAYSAN